MDTLEFSQTLIKAIKKKQGGKLYSALEDADFDPNNCFVKYPFHKGLGWVEDAMYGAVGGYVDEDESAHQCDRGEYIRNGWVSSQFLSYGEFGICRLHAEMLSNNLKPIVLLGEKASEKHREIEREAWDRVSWKIERIAQEDFVESVRRGERMGQSDLAQSEDFFYDWWGAAE